jgi:hypothetical protein
MRRMTRALRPLIVAALVVTGVSLASPQQARAEGIGIGLFLGEPTGFDLKIDLQRRSALDVVIGYTTFDDYRAHYAHLTYLVTPFVGRGRSVLVPLRLGIGAAFFDGAGDFGDEANIAVRAPLELGLRFRSVPLEVYGELAIKITILDENDNHDDVDADGGIGLRFYF